MNKSKGEGIMLKSTSLFNTIVLSNSQLQEKRHLVSTFAVIGGSIFIGLMSQLAVVLPFSPVPVTGQTFAILLLAITMGFRKSTLAVLTFLAQGLCGLPVFANGASGPLYFAGPTGGYLIGFLLASAVVGFMADKNYSKTYLGAFLSMIAGSLIIYLCGFSWLSVFLGAEKAFTAGILPFIAGDLIKIMLISISLPLSWKLYKKLSL